jgi:hypothetical protein
VSANKQGGISLAPPDTGQASGQAERRRDRLALVTYWAEAGIASTAAGAWASTAFSGRSRILACAGITTFLVAIAIGLTGPAVSFLSRCYGTGRAARRPSDN